MSWATLLRKPQANLILKWLRLQNLQWRNFLGNALLPIALRDGIPKMGAMTQVIDQTPIRVGIIDPVALDRDAVTFALAYQPGICLLFAADHPDRLPPVVRDADVLLFCSRRLDDVLAMTGEYWRIRCPKARMIVLLERNEQVLAQRYAQIENGCFALRAEMTILALADLIRRVHAGEVVDAFQQLGNLMDSNEMSGQALSARELQVVELLRELGPRQRKAAAQRLGIGYKTYGTHIRNICDKLGVGSVDEIVERVVGVIDLHSTIGQ